MKPSRNNFIVKTNDSHFILANTLTRAIIIVNEQALGEIQIGDIDNLKELTKKQFDELVEMGFLIPSNLDEDLFLDYIMLRERISEETLTTFLMYSTACNFSCSYCYEAGQVNESTMAKETEDSLISWFRAKFEQGKYKVCNIILFGGEPLLFPNFFLKFLTNLKKVTDELGIRIHTNCYTNGYLLSQKILDCFLPFNLNEINVTLDGPAEIHDKLRPLKGNGSTKTFDVILNNLTSISSNFPDITLNCRISFNKSNLKFIPNLLDTIKEQDQAGNIQPYFAHITQTSSQIGDVTSFCSQNVISDDENLAKNYIFLYREAKKRGFKIPCFHTLGPCMLYSASSFLISPNGKLFKCLDMVGFENTSVGDIRFPMYYNTNHYKTIKAEKLKSCMQTNCPFIPICSGGCVVEPWLKYNDYDKIVCHRDLLEAINKVLLLENFS